MKPKFLLHLEGAAVLLASCMLYHHVHGGWLWFCLLFLTPDFALLGYMADNKVGAAAYNLFHTYTVPLLALWGLWLAGQTSHAWLVWIWLAHIGFDRMLGHGLKYEAIFKHTHLQQV